MLPGSSGDQVSCYTTVSGGVVVLLKDLVVIQCRLTRQVVVVWCCPFKGQTRVSGLAF